MQKSKTARSTRSVQREFVKKYLLGSSFLPKKYHILAALMNINARALLVLSDALLFFCTSAAADVTTRQRQWQLTLVPQLPSTPDQ